MAGEQSFLYSTLLKMLPHWQKSLKNILTGRKAL
jgi:hypothetical protein